MRSARPKPLHLLCGREMVLYVLDALADCRLDRAVMVVGHGAERITKRLQEERSDLIVDFVEQTVQRGTGDATSVGLTAFPDLLDVDLDGGDALVMAADTPLLRPATIAEVVRAHQSSEAACTILTALVPDPSGYGRVVRGPDGEVVRIVEEADASRDEKAIGEVNTAIYCFRRGLLAPALRRLLPENARGEYYLTDVVEVLTEAGYRVDALTVDDHLEVHGVNDRAQLALAETELRRRTNQRWMEAGVTMVDPARTYIDVTVELAIDVTILPGTLLAGRTVIGQRCELGPDTTLVDCMVGSGAVVEHSVGRDAEVGPDAVVGPFAVLEPGAQVPAGGRTGPFHVGGSTDDAKGAG